MAQRHNPVKLILASASPRRRALLRRAGIPFRVKLSRVSEASSTQHPVRLVRELALRKARAVAGELREGLVLGADTVVVHGGRILGKPKTPRGASRMLGHLSGSTHRVYTGVALVNARTGKTWVDHAVSLVRMKKLGSRKLLRLAHQHLDKAGAYAIQEKNDPIARVIKGSYDNVVGLPISTVKALLKRLGRGV